MTRRSSVRAQARRNYRDLAAGQQKRAPTPDLSPRVARARGGGEQKASAAGGKSAKPPAPRVETKLTKRVRRLYEDSAVPVREIAAIIGVTERTIYKYVEKHGWQKRYRVVARVKEAVRGDCAPVTGAGGRFIRRADKDRRVATGLKATDPAGARRAATLCDAAAQRSAAALAEAEEQRMDDERHGMWRFVNTQLDKLLRHLAQPGSQPLGSAAPDVMRDLYMRNLSWACDVLEEMSREWRARNTRLPITGEVKSYSLCGEWRV